MGKRLTRKTLEPKLATLSATYLFAPCTMETTMISVETERMTPSSVKNDRSLWERRVSSAISTGSLSETPRRSDPRAVAGAAIPVACNGTLCSVRLEVGIFLCAGIAAKSLTFSSIQDAKLTGWFHLKEK